MEPYGIDLLTAAAEGDWRSGKWLPLIPAGKTVFPQGVLDPSPQMLAAFHANFQSGLFGSKPPVNLQHIEASALGAHGWIEDTRLAAGGLEARVSLSSLGETALNEKRVRYLSAEFAADPVTDPTTGKTRTLWWRNHRTGERHTNMILGAALCVTPRFGSAMVDLLAASGEVEVEDGGDCDGDGGGRDGDGGNGNGNHRRDAGATDGGTTMTEQELQAKVAEQEAEIERLKATAEGSGELEARLKAAEDSAAATAEALKASRAEAAATRARLDRTEILEAMAAPIKVAGRDHVIAPKLRERVADLALGLDADEKLFAAADGTANGRTTREELLAIARDMAVSVAELGERGFAGTAPGEFESPQEELEHLALDRLKAANVDPSTAAGRKAKADALLAVAAERPDLAKGLRPKK